MEFKSALLTLLSQITSHPRYLEKDQWSDTLSRTGIRLLIQSRRLRYIRKKIHEREGEQPDLKPLWKAISTCLRVWER